MIGVSGWFSAIQRSHTGSVSIGTNALETYGRNIRMKPKPPAASGPDDARPIAANR